MIVESQLDLLPSPPPGLTGWPWTRGSPQLPPTRWDGSDWPRITIVTPSYNQGQFIEETIRSILLQDYPNFEYMIIDGGSTDNSLEVIEKYSPWISYWHSRADNGQPDAINFGLERAEGVWFHNVNSDDVLTEGALAAIGNVPLEMDLVLGDVIEFSGETTHTVRNVGLSAKVLLTQHYRSEKHSWHQPGVIFKTARLRELGGYSTNLQYVFDLHATCRYLERFLQWHSVDQPLIRFRIHGDQKSSAWGEVFRKESIACRSMLGEDLLAQGLRSIASREAVRLDLMYQVARVGSTLPSREPIQAIATIVRKHPRLLFDRMLLGSFRRKPFKYFAAMWR